MHAHFISVWYFLFFFNIVSMSLRMSWAVEVTGGLSEYVCSGGQDRCTVIYDTWQNGDCVKESVMLVVSICPCGCFIKNLLVVYLFTWKQSFYGCLVGFRNAILHLCSYFIFLCGFNSASSKRNNHVNDCVCEDHFKTLNYYKLFNVSL